MSRQRLGYKPSPDHAVGLGSPNHLFSAAPLPASASLRGHVVEVLDQKQTSACVAHSITQAIRTSLSIHGVKAPSLPSRLFVYYVARAESGDEHVDGGTMISSGIDALSKMGFPEEAQWPFTDDEAVVNAPPSWEAFRSAADQRWLKGAYRITSTGAQRVHDVKAAIASGMPVMFGTDVDDAIFDLKKGDVWGGCAGTIAGGHAILITGYQPGAFEICNSWGPTYCDDGFFLAAEAAIASPQANDFWVAQVTPNFSDAA